MSNPSNRSSTGLLQMTVILSAAVAMSLITGIIATVTTFILPESYESTARIKLAHDWDDSIYVPSVAGIQNPVTACQVIQSSNVLAPVVEKLNLNDVWGKKYFNGETLRTLESLEILKQRIRADPIRNTTFVSIVAYSDDKIEAAELANAIAESYRDYRIKSWPATNLPPPMLVYIPDPAVPSPKPAKPNKPLNITLGFVFGAVVGSILGGIAAFLISRFGASSSGVPFKKSSPAKPPPIPRDSPHSRVAQKY